MLGIGFPQYSHSEFGFVVLELQESEVRSRTGLNRNNFDLEDTQICTNRTVASLLKSGKLKVDRPCTRETFGKMFSKQEALASSIRRGNMATSEKVEAMWKLRNRLIKKSVKDKVRTLMMKVLSGEKEAVGALSRDPRKIRTNGTFRWYFTWRLLRTHYSNMHVKVMVGAHLCEAEKAGTIKEAYALLLYSRASAAAQELFLLMAIDDLESSLCEYMKFLDAEAARTREHEHADSLAQATKKRRRTGASSAARLGA